ncbi:hypothetical protein BGAL_0294g00020 [Botrytis galanthina]|uniref:Uncharacterized protein n=1 Tax=Botrytis galanthina TaxID=278940 RepID=A0A4S8QVU2_9HELO|nr:hypothetical protein BGAL_0294g00020 [Botrytis galanthina]
MAGQDSRGNVDYFLPPDDLNEIFCVTWKAFRMALYLVLWAEFCSSLLVLVFDIVTQESSQQMAHIVRGE